MHRTANGSTSRVIQRVYKANVSENYVEIHLFWAGKGTCCIPAQGTYGPLVSAISATPGNNKEFHHLSGVQCLFSQPAFLHCRFHTYCS